MFVHIGLVYFVFTIWLILHALVLRTFTIGLVYFLLYSYAMCTLTNE